MTTTAETATSPFVSTEWLAANLGAPDLVVVDASPGTCPMPGATVARNLERHIPGAVHFDIDAIADHTTSLPHMLPDPHSFSLAVGALGIGDGLRVVVYDSLGLFSAPRVWWTFRAFGARDVNPGWRPAQVAGRGARGGRRRGASPSATCAELAISSSLTSSAWIVR